MPVALVEQMIRHLFAVGDDDRRQLPGEQPADRLAQRVFGQPAQVRGLGGADDLNAEWMDEIHVADLADGRFELGLAGQHAVPTLTTGEPVEPQSRLIFREELFDADLPHRDAVVHDGGPCQLEKRRCRLEESIALASSSLNERSLNMPASSDRSCRCSSVACSGTSSTKTCPTGLPSGASNGIGLRGRTNAPSACVRPLMRPWGIAMPWPRPVEPSFSRANRLSNTTERAICA